MADIHSQSVPLPKFPMSAFDLSHSHKLCAQAGWMNCHYVEECIPSDIAHIRTDLFIRLDPLTFPIMHKVKVRQNFFFVPTRLILGDNMQEDFFSCNDLAAKLPAYIFPPGAVGYEYLGKNTIFDQMECQPIKLVGSSDAHIVRNPLPFLMYQKIWMDWYADEVLDDADIQLTQNMLDAYQDTPLGGQISIVGGTRISPFDRRIVSYSKDRFTSAQPDAQRVGEVYLMNPLTTDYLNSSVSQTSYNTLTRHPDTGALMGRDDNNTPFALRSSLTIDELWDEMAVQRFLNSLNEFGNERYIEILAGQFGVISADARLQRSQWLGGNEMVVNISEVLQTSETSDGSPLGNFAGRGITAGRGRDITFKVPEHGFVIGILSIVPENGYASGSPRWLYKSTPLDFAMPRFNNLGEQAVYAGELFSDGRVDNGTGDLDEFGYQPQYDEYRSHPSRATGDFRDDQFLAWHLDRKFDTHPPLNSDFIHVNGQETNRIFNDTDSEAVHYRIQSFTHSMFVRPISRHPIPGKL